MRSLFLASTSWLESVCYLAKEIINAKNVNVQLSFLIRDIWAGGKGHMSSSPAASDHC
jgi:hypothetical protein